MKKLITTPKRSRLYWHGADVLMAMLDQFSHEPLSDHWQEFRGYGSFRACFLHLAYHFHHKITNFTRMILSVYRINTVGKGDLSR